MLVAKNILVLKELNISFHEQKNLLGQVHNMYNIYYLHRYKKMGGVVITKGGHFPGQNVLREKQLVLVII